MVIVLVRLQAIAAVASTGLACRPPFWPRPHVPTGAPVSGGRDRLEALSFADPKFQPMLEVVLVMVVSVVIGAAIAFLMGA